MTAKTNLSSALVRLTEGGTYTFAQLQALCGRQFANAMREQAGVPTQATPKAPRDRRSGSNSSVPTRSGAGFGRLGDRLTWS